MEVIYETGLENYDGTKEGGSKLFPNISSEVFLHFRISSPPSIGYVWER